MSVSKRHPGNNDPRLQVHENLGVQDVPAKVKKPLHLADQVRDFNDSVLEPHPDVDELKHPKIGTLPYPFDELSELDSIEHKLFKGLIPLGKPMLPHAEDESNVFIGQFRGRVVIRYARDLLDYLPGGITGLVKGLRRLT
jgi:hypothetical protein